MNLTVNGESRVVHASDLVPLADILRDHLSMLGTKTACNEGFCGSCTVLVDDVPVVSCLLPVGLLGGRAVRTVESLAQGDTLSPLQQCFKDADVVQCGMCFPGILMRLTALLEEDSGPTAGEIRRALVGNICRCTGYERIVSAVDISFGDQRGVE